MDVAGPWSVSTGHSLALLLTSKTQKKNRVGCFRCSFVSRFEILWLTLCQLYNEFVIEVRLSSCRGASLSKETRCSFIITSNQCFTMDAVFAVCSSFLSTPPQRRRKGTPRSSPSTCGVSWLSKFPFQLNTSSSEWDLWLWLIYRLRRAPLRALGVPITDYSFEDCQLAMAEGQLRLPVDTCLLEYAKLVRRLGWVAQPSPYATRSATPAARWRRLRPHRALQEAQLMMSTVGITERGSRVWAASVIWILAWGIQISVKFSIDWTCNWTWVLRLILS